VSEFRIEKRRAEAALTLATGATVQGCFFLSDSSASRSGPERVADLLNAETGFFPFELHAGGPPQTVVYNRRQLLLVALLEEPVESQFETDYSLAKELPVHILLSNGSSVEGQIRVYRPSGRDRLSDYARAPEAFRYVETAAGTVIINADHIVEFRETTQA
jgi:hypothetical protein